MSTNNSLNKAILLIVLNFSLTACVGPLLSHKTGRSLGKGKSHIQIIGASEGYYGADLSFGITENFDLGLHYEVLAMGLSANYSFINNPQGFALGSGLGVGSTWGGTYTYGAINASYGLEKFELYSSARYTNVSVDGSDVDEDDTSSIFSSPPTSDYSYTQIFLGGKYWFSEKFALGLELSTFGSSSGDFSFDSGSLTSVAAEFRF